MSTRTVDELQALDHETLVSIAQTLIRWRLPRPTDVPTAEQIEAAVNQTSALMKFTTFEQRLDAQRELFRRYGL